MSKQLPSPTVLTIGHSTLPIGEFVRRLSANGVAQLVDVRTIPRSRRNPQFSSEALAAALAEAGIAYTHIGALGGLRRPRPDSINQGWRNLSFRGYADHMQTPEFAQGLDQLMELARRDRTAMMCAEALPWRCHRSLVADALIARGFSVGDIIDDKPPQVHQLTPFAKVEGDRVTYPK